MASSWPGSRRFAEFGVDREGRLLWADEPGRGLLEEGRWLVVDEGWLRPASAHQRRHFVIALAELALMEPPRELVLSLLRDDGRMARLKLSHRAGACEFDPAGLAYARLRLEPLGSENR